MLAQFSVIALDILLFATLVYLVALMRKLKILHAHRDDMRSIISDVILATEASRDAITKLRSSVIESQNSMANYFEDARNIQSEFDQRMAGAKKMVAELETLQKPVPAEPSSRQPGDGNGSKRLDASPRRDLAERDGHGSGTVSDLLTDRSDEREYADPQEREIQRRLASLHHSVNSLRSKITAHS